MKGIPVRSSGDPLTRTLVLAGSYTQFSNWCMYSRVNPRSTMVRYVNDDQALRGNYDFDLVYTDRWSDRRDVGAILNQVRYLRAIGALQRSYNQFESCEIEPDVVD
jgi:hypothetical protein